MIRFNPHNKDIRTYQFLDFLDDNNLEINNVLSNNYDEIFNLYVNGFYNFNKKFNDWFEKNNELTIEKDYVIVLENPIELEKRFHKIETNKFIFKIIDKYNHIKNIAFKHVFDKPINNSNEINYKFWEETFECYAEDYIDQTYPLEHKILYDCIHISKKFGNFLFCINGEYGIIIYIKKINKIKQKTLKNIKKKFYKKYNKNINFYELT